MARLSLFSLDLNESNGSSSQLRPNYGCHDACSLKKLKSNRSLVERKVSGKAVRFIGCRAANKWCAAVERRESRLGSALAVLYNQAPSTGFCLPWLALKMLDTIEGVPFFKLEIEYCSLLAISSVSETLHLDVLLDFAEAVWCA
jgi:hypothetical protein